MKLFYENNSERFLFQKYNNFSFPAHLHRGLELYLVKEGEVKITIGNDSRIMKEGELSIAFPNQIHDYEIASEQGSGQGMLILCPAKMGGDFLTTLLTCHPVYPFLTKDMMHPDIDYAFRTLLQTRPDIPENLPVISAYIQLILARVLPEMKLVKNRDSQSTDLMAQLITYLSEHYTEPVTLESLAKQMGVSKYSISRVFSDKLHTSFCSYLNTLRIDNAKLLLQGTDHDILTIGLLCGYENPRTFNREFKLICDCQPREYRKRRVYIDAKNLPAGN